MLSNTAGWRRKRKPIPVNEADIASRPCPFQRLKGKCALFEKEQRLRASIVKELRAKEGSEEQDEKAETLDRLLTQRLSRRCLYRHGPKKDGRATPQDRIEKLIISMFRAKAVDVPRELLELEDDECGDDADGAQEDPVSDEGSVSLTVRSNSAVDISNFALLVMSYNDTMVSSGQEVRIPNLFAAEIDLNNLQLVNSVCRAVRATGPLTSFRCRYNGVVDGEEFVGVLKKFGFHENLRSLDLAYNKLESSRVLFHLKASFPKLVNLSLLMNPVTRKPDYREQVRRTLPSLMRLDGTLIRKPPLALPHPTVPAESTEHGDKATQFLQDFFGALETEEVDEDFAMKYFHPGVVFSLEVDPSLQLYSPEKYTGDETYELLSAQDRKELDLFQISLRNNSRDLLLGRVAMLRAARGPIDVMNAYLSTVYPPRFLVSHNLGHCILSTTQIPQPQQLKEKILAKKFEAVGAKKKRGGAQGAFERDVSSDPLPIIVTIHGVFSWRTPTMKGSDSVFAAYDRTMTLVTRDSLLTIQNDSLCLRPWSGVSPVYSPFNEERANKLAVLFGFDGESSDLTRVRSVMERTNSDKALFDELTVLSEGGKRGDEPPHLRLQRHNSSTKLY